MPGESDWLARALNDVIVARLAMSAEIHEAAAFHLQQAVEKGLKCLILRSGRRVGKVHDLEVLAEQAADARLPFTAEDLTEISVWAISGRYPETDEEPPQHAMLEDVANRIDAWLKGFS